MKGYCKGQQTTLKPTFTNSHSLLSGREPAGPLVSATVPFIRIVLYLAMSVRRLSWYALSGPCVCV